MINKQSGKKPRLRLRTLALFVSVVFTVTSVSWPAPLASASPTAPTVAITPLENLVIPEAMGSIRIAYRGERMEDGGGSQTKNLAPNAARSPQSEKFVILIQDAHAVSDAQENIRKILGWLSEEHGVRLAALEGARGRIEPILFRTFPDSAVKRKVLAGYEKRGELSGPEMAAVLQDQEGDFRGIENWDLYERNYAAYLAAKQNQGGLLLQWNKVKQACDAERAAVYGVKLNEFQTMWEDFRSDRTPLLDLLLYLSNFSAQLKKSSGYEELPGLIRSIGYEKSGRPGALVPMVREIADQFKARYLRGLGVKTEMNFYNKYQAFMTGEIPAGQMLQYLVQVGAESGKTVKLTPALKKLLGHTEVLSEIQGTQLAEELDRFLLEVEAGLVRTSAERALADKYHRLFLVRDLINLELSFKDLAAYEKDSEAHQALFKDTSFAKSLEPALAFYQSAIERDHAFYKNIESMMDEQGRANRAMRRADRENNKSQRPTLNAIAVVAGGFHTSGIENLLRDKGVPYAVVTPKINSLDGQENYARVMQGDVSYKDYLKTTYFDALMRHASRLLSEALPLPDRSRMLKLWRDNLIRQLAREGRITEAGKYLRYIDAVFEAYAEPMSEADSQTLREKMIGIVRTQLGQFKSDMLSRIWKTFEVQLSAWTDGINQLIAKKELNDASAADLLDRVSRAKPSFLAQLKPMDPAIGIPPLSDKESMMHEPQILQPSGVQVSTEAEPKGALRSESWKEGQPEGALRSGSRSESRGMISGTLKRTLMTLAVLGSLAVSEAVARSVVPSEASKSTLAMISTGESLRANPYSTKVSEDLAGVFYGGEIRSGLLQAGQCCFILVHPKGRNTPLGAAHFFPGNVLADEWASPEEIKDQVRNIKAQFIQAGIGNDSVFYMFQNGPSRKSFSKILQLELSKDYESGGSYDLRGVFGVQVYAFRDQEVWKIKVPTASGDMRLGEGQIGVDGRFQFERMDGELSEESPYAPLWFAGIASLGGMLFYLGRVWKRTGTFSPKGAWRMMREDFSRGQGSVSKREDLTESETRKRSETREEDEDADSEGEEASKEWEGPPGVKIEGYNYHYYPTGGFQFLWHGFTSRVMADLKKKMDDLGIEREEGLERLLASGETLDRLRAVGDSRQLWRIYLNPVDQDDFEIAREIVRSVAQRFSAKCIDLKYLAENFFTKKLEIDSSRVSPLVINFLDRADLEAFYAALRADPRYAKIQGAGPTLLSSPLLKEDGTVDPLACMVEGGAGQGYAEDRLRELFKKESPEAFVRGVSLARGGDLDRVLKVIRNLWEDERGSAEQGQPNLRGKAEKVMVLLLRMKTKVTLEAGAKKIEGDLPEKLPLSLKLSGLDVFADMDVAPDGKDFLITIRQGQDPDSNPSVIRLPIGTASKIIVGRKDVPVGASGASADWRLKISRQQLEIGIDRDGAITLKHLSEVSRTSFVQDSERSEDDAGNRAKRSEARAGRDGVEDLSPDALGRVNRAFEDYMDVIKSIQAIPNYATRLAVDDAFRTAMEELMIPAYDALATALFDLGILGGEGLRILYPFMGTDLVLALRGKTRHINWHARDIELGKGSLARTLKDFKASDKAIANLEIDPKTELDATDPRNYEFLKEKGRPPYVLVLKGFAFYGGRIADREDTLKIILSYLQPQDRVLVLTKSDAEILERMRIPVLDQLELYEGGSIAALEGGPHEQRKVLLMPDRLAVLRKDGKGSLVSVPLAGALALEALRLIADERSVRGDDISIMAEKYGFGQYSQDQQTLVAMVKLIGQTNPTHNNLRQTLFWLSGGEEVTPAELASRILRHEVIFNEDESYRCFEPRSESRLGSQSLKDILQKYIPKGTDVRYLDLDTGLGNFLPEFDDSLDALGYKVKMGLGTESDPSVRGKSKEVLLSRIVPYDVLEGDLVGTDVDFAEHSFDIVTINNVVTRYRGVPEATRLAEQAKRLLKRDQSVLLVTVEESDAEAGLDKQVAVDIEKAGFEVTVQDMPEDYPSYEGFTAKKLIIARPRISGGGFGQGAIMSLSAVNDALRRILEAHKGTVENEGVAQEAAGYQFILSSWNISGRRIEDLEETDLLLLEQMKAFIQKYEGITLPKLPPEPAVVGEDAPLPVGLLKQLLEQMATTAVKTEAPEKMRSEMRALGETELKKLEGEFDKGIKNVLGPVLAAKTPAAIRSYVEDDAFEAAMLKEFEPRLNPFFGDESAKRVKAVVESIRQTFAEIDVAGVGLGIRGFVDAGPSGLRKDEIVVATAVLDVMDAITGKTQESPIIVVINHSDSDNDRVLKILELLTLNRLILLHRKDQRVGRGFNLPSVPLTTVVYDQENPQKTADKQVGNLKVDGTVVALMTDDLRIGKVGVYTIIAEIGRISDPDLKALACAAIRHVLLKYSSATETERELMKTNPALILTDLKIKGFEAVIRFNGNVMTFDVQKLADLFSAKQSIEQAA